MCSNQGTLTFSWGGKTPDPYLGCTSPYHLPPQKPVPYIRTSDMPQYPKYFSCLQHHFKQLLLNELHMLICNSLTCHNVLQHPSPILKPHLSLPLVCFLSFNNNTQTTRDHAIERASELQKQLDDLHKDHEKLRTAQVKELHGKVSFIG